MTKIKKFLTGIFAVVFAVTLGFGSVGAKSAKADDQPPPPPTDNEITSEAMYAFISGALSPHWDYIATSSSKLYILVHSNLISSFVDGTTIADYEGDLFISTMAAYLVDNFYSLIPDPLDISQVFSRCRVELYVHNDQSSNICTEITSTSGRHRDLICYSSDFENFAHYNSNFGTVIAMTSWSFGADLRRLLADIQNVNAGGDFSSLPVYVLPPSEYDNGGGEIEAKVFDRENYSFFLDYV